MSIIGIGIDLAELSRIAQTLHRFGEHFLNRIMSPEEQQRIPQPLSSNRAAAYVAARFAAREAAVKALGTGFSNGIAFTDIRVVSRASGAPELLLSGPAAARAAELGVSRIHLTLTHTRDNAAAVVILEA